MTWSSPNAHASGLRERPGARPLAVEAELGGEPVEPVAHRGLGVAELRAADDRCEAELALPASGLGSMTSHGSRARPPGRCRRAGPGAAAPPGPGSVPARAAARSPGRPAPARTVARHAPTSPASRPVQCAASSAADGERRTPPGPIGAAAGRPGHPARRLGSTAASDVPGSHRSSRSAPRSRIMSARNRASAGSRPSEPQGGGLVLALAVRALHLQDRRSAVTVDDGHDHRHERIGVRVADHAQGPPVEALGEDPSRVDAIPSSSASQHSLVDTPD